MSRRKRGFDVTNNANPNVCKELTESTSAKLRYVIFRAVSAPLFEVWLCPSACPGTWRNISAWDTLGEARGAVARYLGARESARSMGCMV